MDKRGQTIVEVVILLAIFTAVAAGGSIFRSATLRLYETIVDRRSGIRGMYP